jgi:hypothetical protein
VTLTWTEFSPLYKAGADIRRTRKDRKDHGQRSPEQVRELREQAAKSATICADCFRPLAPGASVTMVKRRVHIPARKLPFRTDPAQDRPLTVPICLTCWLIAMGPHAKFFSGPGECGLRNLVRFRCEGCGRPIRRNSPDHAWYQTERVCCTDCHRAVVNAQARIRRKVHHDAIICEGCGEAFAPKRSDARTCSDACRQKAFRRARAGMAAAP